MANDARRFRIVLLSAAMFVLALALRVSNAPFAFGNGIPLLSPLDELYHWKRITWSAVHFPGVLEFDVDRGVRGEFCPWPPLYDLLAGGTARLLGAHTALDVLVRAVWFPPLLGALFVALTVVVLAGTLGDRAAIACGIALAASPYVVTQSWIGSIDHHFLEWPLTFAILGATCLAVRGAGPGGGPRPAGRIGEGGSPPVIPGILLGCAITAAMFVQTALLIPAALAFAVLIAFTDGTASAIGFGIAAIAVSLYRLTRLPGYPDNQWFLGLTHAALFAGAAVASLVCAVAAALARSASGNTRRHTRLFALAAGATVAAAVPTALASILGGIRFFGGETWLQTIEEFQPLWRASGDDLLSYGVGLGAGAILVWFLAARAIRERDAIAGTVALFAITHLLLTISSRRFAAAGIPLLALAGALWAAGQQPSVVPTGEGGSAPFAGDGSRPPSPRPRLALLALALIAIPPPIQFAVWMRHPDSMIPSGVVPWVRAARFLHQRAPGRVLAPWSMGHVLDVIGEHPVIVDNFGTMPDAVTFDRAHDAMLARDEEMLARYCRENGVRYIVLHNPLVDLTSDAEVLGIDPAAFIRITGGMPRFVVSRLAEATWWWRAYFNHGAAIPAHGIFGRPFRHFRPIYTDPQLYGEGTPFRGPRIVIWELDDAVR